METQKIKFAKVRDVKMPSRGTSKSAGIDFFIPNDFEKQTLQPLQSILIPSGLHCKVPENHALIAHDKSGVSTILGLKVGAKVVDEDYQGEIHIHLTKITPGSVTLTPGLKIVQFLLIPVSYHEPEEVNPVELYESASERGTGGFGSTGVA